VGSLFVFLSQKDVRMQVQDQERLERVLQGKLSEVVMELYGKAQRVWGAVGSGPMPDYLILMIALLAGDIEPDESPPSPWETVESGTWVVVKDGGGGQYEATFQRMLSGLNKGQLEVWPFGDNALSKRVLQDRVHIRGTEDAIPVEESGEDVAVDTEDASPANDEEPEDPWGSVTHGDPVSYLDEVGNVVVGQFRGFADEGDRVMVRIGLGKGKPAVLVLRDDAFIGAN
jgi:hypothetical protein